MKLQRLCLHILCLVRRPAHWRFHALHILNEFSHKTALRLA